MPGIKLPTAAERLRTLLAAASSLTLHVPGHRCDLIGRHHVDAAGRVVVELPADSHVALLVEAEADLGAVIEITDVAPTPVRPAGGPVRSRATFAGWLQPAGDDGRLQPAGAAADDLLSAAGGVGHESGEGEGEGGGDLRAVLELASATLLDPVLGEVEVEADVFAAARPDPLATHEADLLCHLTDAHPEAVERLCRLVAPHHLHGVHRVVPVRMDRFGVVLRLEFAGRHRDVQLPFSAPLRTAADAAPRMHELLARARCGQRDRSGH
ncbi:DUF2470 domain-containing protein [Dactylosporangium aurantiacum]|uniref:DUF2470 domain-containing protein n=1 Tax=Dactylosporangium aurantiacum TaxID=35754 RepID=A0A9Q9IG45_9ACTN|nr:DUF2470 domain-containing protein [Dactylosporangium aurantiacum]MDG6110232.1 DUF2470 domain-containing protein [Dactylosporangium aurantiacum]UWZ55427.1 DUF2470 domain-containing protein [Dactylosporangium aurantiacum]